MIDAKGIAENCDLGKKEGLDIKALSPAFYVLNLINLGSEL